MKKTGKTFAQWAKTASITSDPVGDFLSDWRSESAALHKRPRMKNRADLINYLNRRDACDEAIDAAKEAWIRFEAWAAEGATK